jgi:hypothetical protein
MSAPICGRRAPDFSGNAPSKIERFGRRLDPYNTQADLAFQEIEAAIGSPMSAEPLNEAEAACPPSFSGEALALRFAERKI